MLIIHNPGRVWRTYLTLYCALLDIGFWSATFFLTFIGAMWDGVWEYPYPETRKEIENARIT